MNRITPQLGERSKSPRRRHSPASHSAPPPAPCGKILLSNCGNPQEIFPRPTKNKRCTIHTAAASDDYVFKSARRAKCFACIYLFKLRLALLPRWRIIMINIHHQTRPSEMIKVNAANLIRVFCCFQLGLCLLVLCVWWLCSKSDTRARNFA